MIIKRCDTGTDVSSTISELIANNGTIILWASIQIHKTAIAYTYNGQYWAVIQSKDHRQTCRCLDALEAIICAQQLSRACKKQEYK